MKEIKVVYNRIDFDYYQESFGDLVKNLYPSRQEAVRRFKNKEAAIVSLVAGIMLQDTVKRELGIDAFDIFLEKNENGKPSLAGYPEFHFNLSHSGEMVFLAYGNSPVGIDVEKLRCGKKDINVAKRCFTKREYEYILEEETKEHRFTSIWTMKEAYLKYKGTGISVPLNAFEVNPEKGIVEGEDLKIYTGQIGEYIYSLCVEGDCEVFYDFEF